MERHWRPTLGPAARCLMLNIVPEQLTIVKYPDPVLRKVCAEIDRFDGQLAAVAERMLDLMIRGQGVGLAAPQVGLLVRMFVCNPTGEPSDNAVYINPVLDDLEGTAEAEEGCLCLPGVIAPIKRAQRCVIRARNLDGVEIVESDEDLIARIWQHETDHLDGRLIVDRMGPAATLANRRSLKQLEDDYAADGR